MIDKIKSIFKGKEIKAPSYWIMIEWSIEAVRDILGYNSLKYFIHFRGTREMKREAYSEALEEYYKEKGYVVYDHTAGQRIPKESLTIPAESVLGRLQIDRRLRQ